MADGEHPLVGKVLKDRYHVESLLGAGGMGSVLLARDAELNNRRVVVKIPRTELLSQPGFPERFRREMGSLMDVEHPSIVSILDRGEQHGMPYAVLQYLAGQTLEQKLIASDGSRRRLDRHAVLQWLPTVARALDFIHDQGFVHRDIKPGSR